MIHVPINSYKSQVVILESYEVKLWGLGDETVHLRSDSKLSFPCPQCEKCDLHFRHKSQLRLHLRQKHGAVTNTKAQYRRTPSNVVTGLASSCWACCSPAERHFLIFPLHRLPCCQKIFIFSNRYINIIYICPLCICTWCTVLYVSSLIFQRL